jgi:hypothetical protein
MTMRRIAIPKEPESGVRLREDPCADELRKIVSAAQAASIGFDVCARRASTKEISQRMRWLASEARAIAESAATRVPGGVRGPTTSERMRWEWLASTAALLDGGAEGRLADEAKRHVAIAEERAAKLDDDALLDRIAQLAATSRAVAA